jgi:hypothetical protein
MLHYRGSQYSVFEDPEAHLLRGWVAARHGVHSRYMAHFFLLKSLPLEAHRAYYSGLIVSNLCRFLQAFDFSIFVIPEIAVICVVDQSKGNAVKLKDALRDATIVIGYLYVLRRTVMHRQDFTLSIDVSRQKIFEECLSLLLDSHQPGNVMPMLHDRVMTPLAVSPEEVTASPSTLPVADPFPVATPKIAPSSGYDALVSNLLAIEKKMQEVTIENFFQQQWMVWCRGPDDYQPILQEWFVSMAHIFNLLDPPVSLGRDRRLMGRLTHSLDRSVLEVLSQKLCPYFPEKGVSLNLHAESVLLPVFDRWMGMTDRSMRPTIAIELPVLDMIEDYPMFQQAVEKIRGYGCRVILDGMSMDVWSCLSHRFVTCDWVKILWDGERAENTTLPEDGHFPMNRIILCRCDTQAAIDWGVKQGIRIFQGWRLDQMLEDKNKTKKGL